MGKCTNHHLFRYGGLTDAFTSCCKTILQKISSGIITCLQSIEKESMRIAAKELRILNLERLNDSNGTEPVNCVLSCDGTWQKQGFSSRNGCVTAISIDTARESA